VLILILSALALAGFGVSSIALYRAMPSDVEVFEQWVGIKATADVEILSLNQDGFGDFLELQVCFRASQETIETLIQTRKLEQVLTKAPLNPCVGANATHYIRGAGPGRKHDDRVGGFAATDQLLLYDPKAGTAYYTFLGID